MLSGYLFGDGHFSKVGVKANTISLRIRDGVDVLARKLGLVGNFTTQNKFPNNLQHWWSLDKQQTQGLLNMVHDYDDLSFIFQDKLIHELDIKNNYHHKPNFRKLSSVTVGEYSGLVYNLEVEEDNSYTTEGVAVHNCDAAIYLVRNIVRSKNPYPETWGTGNGTNMFKSKLPQKDSGVADKIKTILNIKKK